LSVEAKAVDLDDEAAARARHAVELVLAKKRTLKRRLRDAGRPRISLRREAFGVRAGEAGGVVVDQGREWRRPPGNGPPGALEGLIDDRGA